ncbi:Ig-like domain-containing protein, partial [Acinetobacter baumannii]
GQSGRDSFGYTATGPGGTSPAATVTLTVATPAAPSVAAKTASVAYDTATPIDLTASVSGVHSSLTVSSAPAHGTTSIAGDVITYTPTTGEY